MAHPFGNHIVWDFRFSICGKKKKSMYKLTGSLQGLEYKNKVDRLKHCNLNSVSQRWKHTGLCTEAGEWKHSCNSPVIAIRWLSLCLALRGHVWWPPVIVYGGSLNSASQGGNASLLQWALKMPLLPQYSLVPLLSADGPPPDAGYTHYGVLDGSIWWVGGRWGAERQHEALTNCPMDMFYIPWHSLARTCSPLSTAPDMTWRPWLWSGQHVTWTQMDTGDTSQAFFGRATQNHLTPASLSLWIITSAAHDFFFLV